MAWQTPKTNWTGADGVRNTDFNRIEGNIEHLYRERARSDVYLYVSTSNGNDNTGSGTAAAPYRTINKALSMVPRSGNGHNVVINIAGGYYPEDVTIKGFDCPVTLTNSNASVTVTSLIVDGCHCSLDGNIVIITSSAVRVINGGMLTGYGSLHIDGAYLGLNNGATVALGAVKLDNSPGFALTVENGSRFYAALLDGNANAFGLSSQGGSVLAFGDINMEIDDMIYFTALGGRIYSGAQSSIPNY